MNAAQISPPNRVDLASILKPISIDEFVGSYLSKRFLLVRGDSERFSSLFNWNVLNEVVRICRTDSRVRLVKDGKPVRLGSSEAEFRGRSRYSSLLISALQDGATLIVNGVDDLHQPLTTFCYELERGLRTHIGVNLYASWSEDRSRGFDLHWDDHDVFILQIEGRKQWKVYGQTMPFPITRGPNDSLPTGPPEWDGQIARGDMLYIPRGFWHVATPCDESTLHLTVGIYNPTGLTMLRWLVQGLSAVEAVRMDLPRFAAPEARARYQQVIQDIVAQALQQPDLLRAFERFWDVSDGLRPRFGFPWSAQRHVTPESDFAVIQLVPRHVQIDPHDGNGAVDASFNNQSVLLTVSESKLLEFLIARAPIRISTYYDECHLIADRDVLRATLATFNQIGLIVFRE